MMVPIDIHTHILPGMDDGSKNVAESIAMLREETRQGLRAVALTPHFYAGQNSPQEFLIRRQKAWDRLRPELEEGMPRLLLGAEVQYFEGISRVADIGSLCIGDTGYLLLEMPFQKWTEREIHEAASLQTERGLRVILAHVDRYFAWESGAVWEQLAESGIGMQLNADAFFRLRKRMTAKRLLKKGMVQFLGSDCHNLTTRPPDLSRAELWFTPYSESFLSV